MTFSTRVFAKTLLLTTALSFMAVPGIERAYGAFEWTPPTRTEEPVPEAPESAEEIPAQPQPMTPEIPAAAEPVAAPAPVPAPVVTTSETSSTVKPLVPPANAVDIFADPGAAAPSSQPVQALTPAPVPQDIKTEVVTQKDVPAAPATPVVAPASAAAPVAAESEQVKDSNDVLQGFGKDLPLIMAVRQIVPANVSYAFGEGVDLSQNVSWSGGDNWQNTLRKITDSLHYELKVNGNNLRIMSGVKAAPQPEVVQAPVSPSPALAPVATIKPLEAKVEKEVGAEVVEIVPQPIIEEPVAPPAVKAQEPIILSAPSPVKDIFEAPAIQPSDVKEQAAAEPSADENMGEVKKSLEEIVKEAEKAMGASAKDKAVKPLKSDIVSEAPVVIKSSEPVIAEVVETEVKVEVKDEAKTEAKTEAKPVEVVEEKVVEVDDVFLSNLNAETISPPAEAAKNPAVVNETVSEAMQRNQIMERDLADILEESGSNYDDPFAMVDEGRPAESATSLTPGQIVKSLDDLDQEDTSPQKTSQAPSEKSLPSVAAAENVTVPVVSVTPAPSAPSVPKEIAAHEIPTSVSVVQEPVNIMALKDPAMAEAPEKSTEPVQIPEEIVESKVMVVSNVEPPPSMPEDVKSDISEVKAIEESVKKETPAAPTNIKYQDVQTWKVKKGADLKETVEAWSKQAGVTLDWKLEQEFDVDYMVWVDGTFEEAINTLMQGYTSRQGIKPMAQFSPASEQGPTLSVRSAI